MTEKIRFEIPDWVDEDDFEKYFKDNIDEYTDALDQSANSHDDRSQVDEITLESIDLYPDSVTVYYNVEISAYHGCRDVNYAETDERDVTGSREGRVFIFDKHVYPAPRTPFEEF
ncbi:hypothetical protein J2W49_003635 [Hydrogenophaga palleronii]|uniref:Uncharacterized protein n=1 Tax=Hydrogenophaga palleronii TaxID=65655 RepID=A0ABU1WRI0_9BURK|nr:hypothetical protein [Hydrogenophaga palleronii]MDR7151659.1 hypothetical protein [Hydrogenophaga palleronii]